VLQVLLSKHGAAVAVVLQVKLLYYQEVMAAAVALLKEQLTLLLVRY
jgi:hypothetical protein